MNTGTSSNRRLDARVAALVLGLLIVVAAFVYASFSVKQSTSNSFLIASSDTSAESTTSSSPSSTVSTFTNLVSSATTYAVSNPTLGIRLVMSLNTSAIDSGGAINYTAAVYNTRQSVNNVSSASNWAVGDLISTATGPTDSPIAFAVVQGHYVASNITSAPSIDYGICCTTVMGGITTYSFKADSDIASVYGAGYCNPCFTKPVSTWRLLDEYFVGVGAGAHAVGFTAGIYTVVAEDEWGDIALASFTVT